MRRRLCCALALCLGFGGGVAHAADPAEQGREVYGEFCVTCHGRDMVNPGGVTAWKWGKDAKAVHEPVEGYSKVTPAKIIPGSSVRIAAVERVSRRS